MLLSVTTVNLPTPDFLETVNRVKNPEFRSSGNWMSSVIVCNFSQNSGSLLVWEFFFGPIFWDPGFDVSLLCIISFSHRATVQSLMMIMKSVLKHCGIFLITKICFTHLFEIFLPILDAHVSPHCWEISSSLLNVPTQHKVYSGLRFTDGFQFLNFNRTVPIGDFIVDCV